MRFVRTAFLLIAAAGVPAWAQFPSWDTSGNYLLNGTYHFRNIIYSVGLAGALSESRSVYGTMTFDGAGGYTISNATVNRCTLSTGCTQETGFSASNNYWLAAGGHGFLINPISSIPENIYRTYFYTTNGIILGSMIESGFNSIFVAAPVGIPPTLADFQGDYQLYGFFPAGIGNSDSSKVYSWPLTADGAGNIGTAQMTGYSAATGSTLIGQNSPGVTYTFTNGAGTITFPPSTTANFYSGDVVLYMSPDRNLVFGGGVGTLGMFVGTKIDTNVTFRGLYFQAGMDVDTTQLNSQGFTSTTTFLGALDAEYGHEHVQKRQFGSVINPLPYSYSNGSVFPVPIANGTYTDVPGRKQFTFGNGGAIRVGWGFGGTLFGIRIALKAPTMSGSGVYLDPNGVFGAASFSPGQGMAPGQSIVLHGTGLASGNSSAAALPLPTILGNVQVLIDGIPAPLRYVTSTEIGAVTPFGIHYDPPDAIPAIPKRAIATIQVINNGVASNTITHFVNNTAAGVFTLDGSGLGYGLIADALTGQIIDASNPARPGQTVSVYAGGLGEVTPVGVNGAVPTMLSPTVAPVSAVVGGFQSDVSFAGLSPAFPGVYQVNLTVPLVAVDGDALVEIKGPDSDNMQALIPIFSGNTASAITGARPSVQSILEQRMTQPVATFQRPVPCLTTAPACGVGIK